MSALGELTAEKIDQGGPPNEGEFTYVDISSVDNKTKRIVEPRRLATSDAPSRAKQRLRTGDVLVSMTRPNLNAVAMVPPELDGAVGSTGFHILRANESVLPHWLYYGVQARPFVNAMTALVQGALYPAVRPKDIRAFDLPTPPIEDQRRIVAEIEKQFSRLDEAVVNLQRVRLHFAKYVAATLNAAVTGKLVESEHAIAGREGRPYENGAALLQQVLGNRPVVWSGRGKYPWPQAPDTASLGRLPPGWTWATADQLSDFITKGTTPAAEKLIDGAGDVQFLKVYNLTFDGRLNHQYKPVFVSRETHEGELNRSKVAPGDVLMNIVGPPLGQVSFVPEQMKEANINQAIARLRPVPPVAPRFVGIALMADEVMRWAVRRAKTTAGQANLTLELCRALPIPVPPLAEQLRIVAEVDRRLSIVREVEAEVDANLKRAQVLRQAVLARAFSGRLVREAAQPKPRPGLKLVPGTSSIQESARIALSAEVVHRLHAELTFGRVKHQKVVHLCEYIAQLADVQGAYRRAQAGPLDLPMIEANEAAMERLNWYAERSRDKGHLYVALSKAGEHTPYLSCFSDEQLRTIRQLIELMRSWKSERCEMFSTVYAAWNDLLLAGREATPEAIVREVLELWHDSKLRIGRQQWLDQIQWMKEQGFVPVGWGNPTRGGSTPDLFQQSNGA